MMGSLHGLASSPSSLATRYLLMPTDLYSPIGFPHWPLKQESQSCKHETSTCQVRTRRWDDCVSQLQAIPESWNMQEGTPSSIFSHAVSFPSSLSVAPLAVGLPFPSFPSLFVALLAVGLPVPLQAPTYCLGWYLRCGLARSLRSMLSPFRFHLDLHHLGCKSRHQVDHIKRSSNRTENVIEHENKIIPTQR